MNFFKLTLLLFLTVITSNSVNAKNLIIENSEKTATTSDIDKIVNQIRDLHDYYMSSPDPEAGNSIEERIKRRNNKIKELFKKFESDRTKYFERQRFSKSETQSCTSHRGATKRCTGRMKIDRKTYKFIRESVKTSGNGLKAGPTFKAQYWIEFTVGKSGKGSNVITLTADYQYIKSYIDKMVNGELKSLRRKLKQLNLPDDNA